MSTRNGATPLLELRDAQNFLYDEAELLDQGRFEEWMDLFTADGDYWVPMSPGQDNPRDMVSHFYDDRPMMEARIRRLREPSNLVYNARTRCHHHVANVRVRGFDASDQTHRVSSYVLMVESRPDEQRVFSGVCEYRLRVVDGALKIVRKKVVLVNCDAMFGPLAIPF